jgi:hypothetical protein
MKALPTAASRNLAWFKSEFAWFKSDVSWFKSDRRMGQVRILYGSSTNLGRFLKADRHRCSRSMRWLQDESHEAEMASALDVHMDNLEIASYWVASCDPR